jgi:putative heme-binding domain-containing protein
MRFFKLRMKRFLTAVFLSAAILQVAADRPNSLGPLVALLNQSQDVTFQLDVLKGISQAMQGRSKAEMPKGWGAVESKLGKSSHGEIRTLTRSLSLTFGSENALNALRTILKDKSAATSDRLNAMNALVQTGDPQLPGALLILVKDPDVRSDAIRHLARFNQTATPGVLLEVYNELTGSEKQRALSVLASRAQYAKSLLGAIERGGIPKSDLSAALVRELRNLKDDEINTKLESVWGTFRESTADKKTEIDKFKRVYFAGGSTPGDATRGRSVFARACQQCHTLFGVGGKVGPDITGSDRGNLDYLLQNIVDPNAVIPNDYRSSEIETEDGRVITGIIQERTGNSLKIATATEIVLVPQGSIEANVQSELSMMPEGLLAPFKDQEIRDLLYYLRQSAQAPLLGSRDNVDLFFNGVDLTGWDGEGSVWRVEGGEIVGETKTGLKRNEFLKSDMILKDFRLILEVKLTPNSENSGIQFRSQPAEHGEVKGYQADAGQGWWGKLYEELGRALLWDKPGDQHVNKEAWNTYEILAVDHHIQTAINGNKCVDLKDPDGALQGIIALQAHSGGPMEVRFRNFQLEVDPEPVLKTVKR